MGVVGRICGGLLSLSFVLHSAIAASEPSASECQHEALKKAENETSAVFAQRNVDQGQKCVDAGDFDSAYRAFYAAYSADPSTPHLWQLALIEAPAGYPGSALRHVREYLTRKDVTKENVKKAVVVKESLRPLVGRLHVTAPPGTTIDAFGPVGVTPLADWVPLDPDDLYLVRASGPTFTQRRLAVAHANEDIRITFPLPPTPEERASDAGATAK